MADTTDVAIIGGGPAGAALAIGLARRGIQTTLIERQATLEWRACGVFSSPLTREHLHDLEFSREEVDGLSRPIAALDLETLSGVTCRISYERGHALGFARPALDQALLDRAREAGAHLRMATVCHDVTLDDDGANVRISPVDPASTSTAFELRARIVVGADGSGLVARAAGAKSHLLRLRKAGITFHRNDPASAPAGQPLNGRFLFGTGWYVGVAPVPGDKVNVGIVVPAAWLSARPEPVVERVIGAFPAPQPGWIDAPTTDGIRVAGSLGRGVDRVAARGWLLVGDACGFIDPLTGEGLRRAFASAEMASDAIARELAGDRAALSDYDRRVRATFRDKNLISWILQVFLSRPAALDYALRRLGRRDHVRETLTLVLTDQEPASRALDPRFLARLLRP